jgi:hypothetical protein
MTANGHTNGDYRRFLASKAQLGEQAGFEPLWLPDFLHPFQASLDQWAIRKGRAAIFADCGLGKTPIQLVWAENVVRHTNRPVLILTPLAVSHQTAREADKFGIEAEVSRDGQFSIGARIVITNYEKLHLFSPSDFAGCVCDESGCIKDFAATRTAAITEFMRTLPYRLLCTATAAPNDYVELGTSAEALGELGFQDMVTRFFKKQTSKDHLGWGRTKYLMRAHAEHDFWRWVCSWARACRKPSDLGFDDGPFLLPPLTTREIVIQANTRRPGFLFDLPAVTLEDQREERRRTLAERCELVAGLVADTGRPAIAWCDLNDEGNMLEKLIPDAVQVSGADSDDAKEEKILAFISGQARVLVSKPVVAGFGLNLQNCAHLTYFPAHSFERWYQSVRRCWRFGQANPVHVDIVTSEGERGVLANLNRKAEQAEVMFERLVTLMNDHLRIERPDPFTGQAEAPSWLSGISVK